MSNKAIDRNDPTYRDWMESISAELEKGEYQEEIKMVITQTPPSSERSLRDRKRMYQDSGRPPMGMRD